MNNESLKRGLEIAREKQQLEVLIKDKIGRAKELLDNGNNCALQVYYNSQYFEVNLGLTKEMNAKMSERLSEFLDSIENMYNKQIKALDKEFEKL